MSIWKRRAPVDEPAPEPVLAPPTAGEILAWEFGDQWCSARGCSQKTGLACSYVDRHQRACPTAWCPEHRHISRDAVFCPTHGRFLDGTADEYRETVHADIGNAVPLLLAGIVQEVDAEVSEAMAQTAQGWLQTLVIDPVRFSLVGVERVRTWERAWKVCDSLGPTLRLALVIEEAQPDVAEARIQSRAALRLPIPPDASRGLGESSATPAAEAAAVQGFRERLLAVLLGGVAAWQEEHAAERGLGLDRDRVSAPTDAGWHVRPPQAG